MKKYILVIICFCLLSLKNHAQVENKKKDSLQKELSTIREATSEKVELLYQLHQLYLQEVNYDSMLFIQGEAKRVSSVIKDVESLAKVNVMEGDFFYKKKQIEKSIQKFKDAEVLIEDVKNDDLKYLIYSHLGINYYLLGYAKLELDSCLYYYYKTATFSEETSIHKLAKSYVRISQAYSTLNKKDSVSVYKNKLLSLVRETNDVEVKLLYYTSQHDFYKKEVKKDSAFKYLRLAYKEVSRQKTDSYEFKLKLNGEYYKLGGSFYSFQEFDSSLVYLDSCVALSMEIKDVKRLGSSIAIVSYILGIQERFEELLDLNKRVLDFAHSIGDSSLMARTKIGITYLYDNTGEYDKAIEVNNELLKNYLNVMSSQHEEKIYTNQSYFFYEKGDYLNAVKYGLRALEMNPESPGTLYNLGDAYLAVYKDSSINQEDILLQTVSGESIMKNLKNGEVKDQVLNLAKGFYEKSLNLLELKKDNKNLIHPHNGLGDYYYIKGIEAKVVYHYEKAWGYSEGMNVPLKDQLRVSRRLYALYKKKPRSSTKALYWLEVTDFLEKEQLAQNNQKELGKKQAEFEFSQKIYADSLKQKEKDLKVKYEKDQQALKLQSEKEKKYYLYGGLFFLSFFLFVLFRRFQLTIKQKKTIELQKESIEEKRVQLRKTHEGVKDSINYSRKIQKAVFPSLEVVKSLFPDSFFFFKPKDVVSGDFYWVYEVDDKKIIVVADCTGHGVPGAFMTIIGINILKEIVQEGIVDSGQILQEINKRLIERLSQKGKKSVKDGMDLALCVIDSATVEFVGAHLSLYHVRNGELFEYKGSKIFLGSSLDMNVPEVHYIPYEKEDVLYMSTDGFPDQKGGEKGKKLYAKRLREFLLNNSSLSVSQQKEKLEDLRGDWINNKYEQLDDITVVGIKL